MKKLLFTFFALFIFTLNLFCEDQDIYPRASESTINLARSFSKEIFLSNGIAYLQPMVQVVNATSNSRFFNNAFIPRKVKKPYFKISVNGMMGFVSDDKLTYQPHLPRDTFSIEKLTTMMGYNPLTGQVTIKDTAALIMYFFKIIMDDGLKKGSLKEPDHAPTVFGNEKVKFEFNNDTLAYLVHNYEADIPALGKTNLYNLLPANLKTLIDTTLKQFPDTYTLPEGADIATIFAGVPQLEIGSLYGTEMLLRIIPSVNLGENVGDFAFWGIGLKHSITQYFEDAEGKTPFDAAVQIVYQGTKLSNKIGVTNAELKANATIWNFNIQASKNFDKNPIYKFFKYLPDIFTGLSYDVININSDYEFCLPVEVQWKLGLMKRVVDPNNKEYGKSIVAAPPEFPGDTVLQKISLKIDDSSVKWVIGMSKQIGPVTIFADYSISKFNVLSGGVQYSF